MRDSVLRYNNIQQKYVALSVLLSSLLNPFTIYLLPFNISMVDFIGGDFKQQNPEYIGVILDNNHSPLRAKVINNNSHQMI